MPGEINRMPGSIIGNRFNVLIANQTFQTGFFAEGIPLHGFTQERKTGIGNGD
ncbi:hypothetical protein OAF56_00225 [Pirellulaceae bacterium]|nr:hypothetical protein [Pirellulaceae bacterium]